MERDAQRSLERELYAQFARIGMTLSSGPRIELLAYLAGHIPGAVSIPVDELRQRLNDLPRPRQIAAYCRGPKRACPSAPLTHHPNPHHESSRKRHAR